MVIDKKAAAEQDYDGDWDLLIYCDCGHTIEGHPPLPPCGPLTSWKASRTQDQVALEKMRNAKSFNTSWQQAWNKKI